MELFFHNCTAFDDYSVEILIKDLQGVTILYELNWIFKAKYSKNSRILWIWVYDNRNHSWKFVRIIFHEPNKKV